MDIGMGTGNAALIELALLPHDGVHNTAIKLRPHRAIMGDPQGRKRVDIERIASPEDRFANEERGPGILMARSELSERGQRADII